MVKYLLCVVSTHKGIAPHPYIWQQHVANQCQWRVHYLSLEQSKLNFSSTSKGICTIIGKNRSRLKYIVEGI